MHPVNPLCWATVQYKFILKISHKNARKDFHIGTTFVTTHHFPGQSSQNGEFKWFLLGSEPGMSNDDYNCQTNRTTWYTYANTTYLWTPLGATACQLHLGYKLPVTYFWQVNFFNRDLLKIGPSLHDQKLFELKWQNLSKIKSNLEVTQNMLPSCTMHRQQFNLCLGMICSHSQCHSAMEDLPKCSTLLKKQCKYTV